MPAPLSRANALHYYQPSASAKVSDGSWLGKSDKKRNPGEGNLAGFPAKAVLMAQANQIRLTVPPSESLSKKRQDASETDSRLLFVAGFLIEDCDVACADDLD